LLQLFRQRSQSMWLNWWLCFWCFELLPLLLESNEDGTMSVTWFKGFIVSCKQALREPWLPKEDIPVYCGFAIGWWMRLVNKLVLQLW
jgi:hypothetical protein